MGSKLIGFRIADDLAEEVEAKAAEKGLSTSELLRTLVDKELYPSEEGSVGDGTKGRAIAEQLNNHTQQLNNHTQQLQQLNGYPKQANDFAGQLNRFSKRLDDLVEQGNSLTDWAKKVRDELPAIRGDILALKGRVGFTQSPGGETKLEVNNPEPEPEPEPEFEFGGLRRRSKET